MKDETIEILKKDLQNNMPIKDKYIDIICDSLSIYKKGDIINIFPILIATNLTYDRLFRIFDVLKILKYISVNEYLNKCTYCFTDMTYLFKKDISKYELNCPNCNKKIHTIDRLPVYMLIVD